MFLVRHAHAGSRHDWSGDDGRRPLSKKGRAQAEAIRALLAERPITRLLSSPSVRCRETLEPLARHHGLGVEVAEALDEGTPLQESMALLRSVFDTEVALCSHGDIIPDLIRCLTNSGTTLHGRDHAAKGTLFVLDVIGADVVSATHVEPAPRSPVEPSKKRVRR